MDQKKKPAKKRKQRDALVSITTGKKTRKRLRKALKAFDVFGVL